MEAQEQRRAQMVGQLQAIERALQGCASEVRAVAGAIVTLDHEGEAVTHRGLLHEAEAKALRTLQRLRQSFTGSETRMRTKAMRLTKWPRLRSSPTGCATVEYPPHGGTANRSGPTSAGRATVGPRRSFLHVEACFDAAVDTLDELYRGVSRREFRYKLSGLRGIRSIRAVHDAMRFKVDVSMAQRLFWTLSRLTPSPRGGRQLIAETRPRADTKIVSLLTRTSKSGARRRQSL